MAAEAWSSEYDGSGGSTTNSAGSAKPDGAGGAGQIRDELNSTFEAATSHAAEIAEPFKRQARELAQNQKNVVAGHLQGLADAIEASAKDVSTQSPNTAEFLRAAASSMKSASGSLHNNHIDDIARSLDQFARDRPGALFAGAAILGFAATRFFKSSNAPQHDA